MVADRRLIYASAGLRAVAVGLGGIILSLHLALVGFDAWAIGLAISLGLAGCAIGTAAVTFVADHLGRRAVLAAVALLMAVGGVALAAATASSILFAAALLGMVNGMGRDRGAGLAVEQTMLPQTATNDTRTTVFAWYNLIVDTGHALGSFLGITPAFLREQGGATPLASYQWAWGLYSVLCLAAVVLPLQMSNRVELSGQPPIKRLSLSSRPVVAKFAALSGLDSFGGGFLTTALLSYWFFRRFGSDETLLGPLFFSVRIANGLSHLAAAWIARRIGLLNTMVFTHLPSNVLLMLLPAAPTLTAAIALFLLRELLVEMDVPTRQSYLVAVVRQEERTRALGITNLTRSFAWAAAPMIGGALMQSWALSAPLMAGAGLKIAYDLLLYRAFRHLKPPEERRAPA